MIYEVKDYFTVHYGEIFRAYIDFCPGQKWKVFEKNNKGVFISRKNVSLYLNESDIEEHFIKVDEDKSL